MTDQKRDAALPEAIRAQLAAYRARLMAAGFTQAADVPHRFYREDTACTAFAVNLRGDDDGVRVVYGYASTAFTRMAGDALALVQRGCSDIHLCESVRIACGEDAADAESAVRTLHDAHRGVEKDALLSLVQAKRKAFIRRLAVPLKSLGFRKVRNTWTYTRPDGHQVHFVLQKSMYADRYYFNVDIRPAGAMYPRICADFRVLRGEEQCLPWQELGEDAMADFLDASLLVALRHLAFTPIETLGRDPAIWQNCCCDRTRCESCWVARNVWEARGIHQP